MTGGRIRRVGTHWADEYARLATADSHSSLHSGENLLAFATAAYLTGHDQQSTDAFARAYRAFLDSDDPENAALCAFWLGFGLFQRGETAQGGGWLERSSTLVNERHLDCVAAGYLLVPAALMKLESGSHHEAYDTFEEAARVAERFDDPDLGALARLGRGQALCEQGLPVDGVALFDEAMVSVTEGEVSAVVAGIIYCAVIDECQRAMDVHRAYEWTVALSRWCDDQPGLVPYRGQCLVHRSQVLQLHGAWTDAMEEARRARKRLSEPPHPAVGMAHYQLGELHRLRGDHSEAEAAYRRAQECGRPSQPGLALTWLARGQVDAAARAIDTAVAEASDTTTRAARLPACVEITLEAGESERARDAADELAAIADDVGTPFLKAAAAHSQGAVLLTEGDPRGALASLRRAQELWRDLEVPHEAARTQVLVALACRAIGDHETARLECDAARRTLAQLGAATALDQVNELFGTATSPAAPSELTPRELQVLQRVAQGRTNAETADDLFISVKTVERHLSNIFTKLGASNRAAATAIAYDRGLL